MNQKKLTNTAILIVIIVILIGITGYFVMSERKERLSTPQVQTELEAVKYINTQYGFSITLPDSWKGYSVITDKWNGQILNAQGSTKSPTQMTGIKILVRHPLWTLEIPRQDIPIMIFTPAEWDLVQQEKLSLGAAPIGPSELGRNANYIFALPARYNFAFPVGFEEVQTIIDDKSFQAF